MSSRHFSPIQGAASDKLFRPNIPRLPGRYSHVSGEQNADDSASHQEEDSTMIPRAGPPTEPDKI